MDHKLQRFISLGWELLEHRYRYYVLDNAIIRDYDYDMLELEYKALAEELGLPPSAIDMVGFDANRHSCQQVAYKIDGGRRLDPKPLPKKTRKKKDPNSDSKTIL